MYTLEQCHFKGYPQKSFTPDSNVLKVDFLKKGGGGTTRILLQMRVATRSKILATLFLRKYIV